MVSITAFGIGLRAASAFITLAVPITPITRPSRIIRATRIATIPGMKMAARITCADALQPRGRDKMADTQQQGKAVTHADTIPSTSGDAMGETTSPAERFAGVERLYGSGSVERLARAHVCVIGIGGVGSWAVEALARSGVGRLTLIDADDVCISNTNRQLHALDGEFGKAKVAVMAERARAINPGIAIDAIEQFLTPSNLTELL